MRLEYHETPLPKGEALEIEGEVVGGVRKYPKVQVLEVHGMGPDMMWRYVLVWDA